MNFEYFLEKDDFLCYSLLQQLIHQAEPIITTSQALQQLQISSYQLNKIIKSLNDEFQQISSHSQSKIETPDKNLIRGTNLSTTLLQQVSLGYLKRSSIFTVFQYQFIYSNMISKTDCMKQHFLSKTNFYGNEARLKEILRKSHFTQNTSMIADPEYAIRLHLFQFFYTAFNGVDSPFPELNEVTDHAISILADSFHFSNSPTQVAKLSIFLKIWLLRIRNQGLIQQSLTASVAQTTPLDKLAVISPIFEQLQIRPTQVELEYLFTFLVTQNYITAPNGFFVAEEMPVPYKLTDQLMQMVKSSRMFTNVTTVDLSDLRQAILAIHVRLITFYVEPTTFISMDQISFFKETYPLFDDLIKQFIDRLFKNQQL